MIKLTSALFIFSFCTFVFLACSKGGTTSDDGSGGGGPHVVTDNDTTKPVLEITAPLANQMFNSGTSINVAGKITDDLGLYRGSIRVINDLTSEVIKEQLYEIHGVLLYNFTINVPVTVSVPTDFTVSVFFEDHGLNGVSRSVKIKVNP